MQIGVIGAGYVGLVLTALLAKWGHEAACIDTDQTKIALLNQGILPIFEPGLEELLQENSNKIQYSDAIALVQAASVVFLCVGTPLNSNNSIDCSAIYATLDQLRFLKGKTVCIKSTVPPRTMQNLGKYLGPSSSIDLVYNPEFMREGSAIQDVLNNNPIVIGSNSQAANDKIKAVYAPLLESNSKLECIQTTPETAELIKYAWNGLSSIRISYINEISRLCTDFSADFDAIIQSISWSEKLLPTNKIKPGCGYGGSCLPKDSVGFSTIFEGLGFSSSLIQQAQRSNDQHIRASIDRTIQFIGNQQRVAILGVAFKSGTDDIRFAPSIPMIRSLLDQKCTIHIFDSHAMKSLCKIFPEVHCYESPYEAVKGSDCIIILTDCQQIQSMDLKHLFHIVAQRKIVDLKNLFSPKLAKNLGFEFMNLGRTQ